MNELLGQYRYCIDQNTIYKGQIVKVLTEETAKQKNIKVYLDVPERPESIVRIIEFTFETLEDLVKDVKGYL